MNLDGDKRYPFKLKIHKKDKYVIKFVNMKSKWKSSNKYNIILNFRQLVSFKKAVDKFYANKTNITFELNEIHWYKWLLSNKKKKVSEFLHEISSSSLSLLPP